MRKRNEILISLLICLSIFLQICLVSAWTDDSSPVQSVDGCGSLITENAVYTLILNVTSTDTCFTIEADNIILNCNGYTINYSSDGGDYEYGIQNSNYDYPTIKNCKIIEGVLAGDDNRGIEFYFVDNGIINNNIITTLNDYGYGIYSEYSLNNTISNNIITTSGILSYGIELRSGSSYNNLSNNTITTSNSSSLGIYLWQSNYNTVLNNKIITSGGGGDGIELENGLFNTLLNNNITTYGKYGRGIRVYTNSNSNVFSYNTIITNNSLGIEFVGNTNNNSFSNMNIKTGGLNGYGIYIYNSNNNFTISDSILNSSLVQEIYVRNAVTGGTWNFINVTKSNGNSITSNWVSRVNGTLNSGWILDVKVEANGIPLENANVVCYDKDFNLIFSELTDINGFISTQNLLEYTTQKTGLNIVSGFEFTDLGFDSTPTVFQKDGNWYLISGESNSGGFYGFAWNGTSWFSNSTITSGLSSIGIGSAPTVFQKDGNWYLISGEEMGGFFGFIWNGTGWQSNATIVSGLGDSGEYSHPTVFQKDGSWYLISGGANGLFFGYIWNGVEWESNTISSGLGDIGDYSTPTVFQKDGNWYLISGEYHLIDLFFGYVWNGTGWQENNYIISGSHSFGYRPAPTVFNMNSNLYLIYGGYLGGFYGFFWDGMGWQETTTDIISTNYYSNYTLNINLNGYNNASYSVNMSTNRYLIFDLGTAILNPPQSWEEVDLDENIVNPNNTEQGLLPSIYYGMATFLSNIMTSAIIIIFVIFFVLIIGVISTIIKKIAMKI